MPVCSIRICRAMPSLHPRSGRLLSCNSMRSSPVSWLCPFNSPFTSMSHSSSCSRVTAEALRPGPARSPSRSCLYTVMVGIRSNRAARGADHLQVIGKEFADVVNAECDHRHPVQSQSPGNNRHRDPEWNRDLRPEQPGTAQLNPTEPRMPHVQFDGRLCKRKISRQTFHFLGLCHLSSEEVQQSQQSPKIDVLAEHNAFDLEKVGGMGRVHLVIAKAARDREILARYGRIGRECMSRHRCPLTPQNQALRPLDIETITPACRSGFTAVL